MPLEERYDKLRDDFFLDHAINYALHRELGTVDKWLDYLVKVRIRMTPSYYGIAFKLLKAITPGTAFKQFIDRFTYRLQTRHPLSNIELTRVSNREAEVRVKNCVYLRRLRELVKKAGLDIDPKFICECDSKIIKEGGKEFGIDATVDLEENGCTMTAKLK